jgi:periplasmic divalent cation tolerance protein
MKSASKFKIALVTAPDLKTARRLAGRALREKLIACANIVPKIESHYWWNRKIERGTEVLMILKTTRSALRKLEKLVLSEHPYDTPEFVVLSIDSGAERYLKWLSDSTK